MIICPAFPGVDADRRLGRAVAVVQAGTGQDGEELVPYGRGKLVAATAHVPERHALRRARLGEEDPEHRRHEHGRGDPLIADQLAR